jgi:hypothetical protein
MTLLSDRRSFQLLCQVLSKNWKTQEGVIDALSNETAAASIVRCAQSEKVLPAFYDAVSNYPLRLAKSERISLAMSLETNRRRNRKIYDAVSEIAEAANQRSIPVAPLKGARWIMEDRADYAAWRSMIDVDLLVPVEHYDAAREVLEQVGYRAVRNERSIFGQTRFAGHYHQVALRRDEQPFVTEVHRHLLWQTALLSTQEIFNQARSNSHGLWLPCPWHAAFHSIVHWQIHHYGYRFGFHRITDGLDIARFLSRSDVDWNSLVGHAERVGVTDEVNVALAIVTDLFGVPTPPEVQISDDARRRVTDILKIRESRLLRWQAKQLQRIDRLWHDHRFLYRARLYNLSSSATHRGLWALRLRRLPFVISHLGSIGLIKLATLVRHASHFFSTRS